MRREKKRLEAVEKYLRQREQLRQKRQRKNSVPSSVTTAQNCAFALGSSLQRAAANPGFFSASEK
jgi:hypothetical protein